MTREPIMRAYADDLLEWGGSKNVERLLQLDWCHTDAEFLTKLHTRGNFVTLFYPNQCTDILATCDGGLIKQIQDKFHKRFGVAMERF